MWEREKIRGLPLPSAGSLNLKCKALLGNKRNNGQSLPDSIGEWTVLDIPWVNCGLKAQGHLQQDFNDCHYFCHYHRPIKTITDLMWLPSVVQCHQTPVCDRAYGLCQQHYLSKEDKNHSGTLLFTGGNGFGQDTASAQPGSFKDTVPIFPRSTS